MTAVVSCGESHTSVISRRGEMFSWGSSTSGETAQGPRHNSNVRRASQVQSIAQIAAPTLEFSADPSAPQAMTPRVVRHWQPREMASQRVVSLACGGHHTMAITEANHLIVCGKGNDGQLGQASLFDSHSMSFVRALRYALLLSPTLARIQAPRPSCTQLVPWSCRARARAPRTACLAPLTLVPVQQAARGRVRGWQGAQHGAG